MFFFPIHLLGQYIRVVLARNNGQGMNRSLANADTSINDLDFRRLRKVLKEFNVRRLNDLLEAIGLGNYMAYVVAQRLLAPDNPAAEAISIQSGGPVAIRGTEGLVISYGLRISSMLIFTVTPMMLLKSALNFSTSSPFLPITIPGRAV